MGETPDGYEWLGDRVIVGVDPGASGGVAVMSRYGVITHKLPSASFTKKSKPAEKQRLTIDASKRLWNVFSAIGPTHAFIEWVSSTPQQGKSSAFSFGQRFAEARMACVGSGAEIRFVTPTKWKESFGLLVYGAGLRGADTAKKNLDKDKAQELFPEIKVTHAIADALLIAEYGRRCIYRESGILEAVS